MDSDIALAGAYEDRPGGSGAWPELMPVDVEEFGFDENPWAWADFAEQEAETERVDIAGAHVTAVLVTLDAARWLPATLEALAKLDTATDPPDRNRQCEHRCDQNALGPRARPGRAGRRL